MIHALLQRFRPSPYRLQYNAVSHKWRGQQLGQSWETVAEDTDKNVVLDKLDALEAKDIERAAWKVVGRG